MRLSSQSGDPENHTLDGLKFRLGHKATVIGVLGDAAPNVRSFGQRFYNQDRWTARLFVTHMCAWAAKNPECIPTPGVISAWIQAANNSPVPDREIVIAQTPDKLKFSTALALMGGAYHEAFHTYYSCLRPLKVPEMLGVVVPRWAAVPDWSKYVELLLEWSNLIEDIRIERCGQKDFPGCPEKLANLQDLILTMEKDQVEGGRSHSTTPTNRGTLTLIMATFRDAGLEYDTAVQREALASYRAENEQAVEFVIGQGPGNPGPLTHLLEKARSLSASDDLGCIRLAMEVIGVLYAYSKEQDPANDPKNNQHQPGGGHKTECPRCNAPGSKLVIRPRANGNGGKVQGVGILTCTACGYQEEVTLKPAQKGLGLGAKGLRFEGFDMPEDEDGDSSAGEPGAGKSSKGKSGNGSTGDEGDGGASSAGDEGDGEGAASAGEADGEGATTAGAGEGGETGGEGAGEGDKSDTTGEGKDGKSSKDESESDKPSRETVKPDANQKNPRNTIRDEGFNLGENESNTDADVGNTSAPGGGHLHTGSRIRGNDWKNLSDDALRGSSGLLNNNTALEEAVKEEVARALASEGGVQSGEKLWSPMDPSLDEVHFVQPSNFGQEYDVRQADNLYASVRTEASYLRARFRQILRAMEMTCVSHGVRRGRSLSSRFLVDSRVALQASQMPKRAYQKRDEQLDISLSAAIVLDQSGSMSGLLRDATRILCAITEPLDALGCPVQVSGFRNGSRMAGTYMEARDGDHHRVASITHDVFKTFEEPLRAIRWRFANTRAEGGTPMADGVQFGLKALSRRTEGHRILFIVTDGQPDGGHMPIMRRQFRLAKEAGIHVVGVGVGSGAEYVKDVFPDAVYTKVVGEMPTALIKKLNQIIDNRMVRGVNYAG